MLLGSMGWGRRMRLPLTHHLQEHHTAQLIPTTLTALCVAAAGPAAERDGHRAVPPQRPQAVLIEALVPAGFGRLNDVPVVHHWAEKQQNCKLLLSASGSAMVQRCAGQK